MKLVKKGKKGIIWVLIYTKAKQEKKANENLQKQGFKTFLPLTTIALSKLPPLAKPISLNLSISSYKQNVLDS